MEKKKMADLNDFGFSTVSEDEYKAQHTTEVNTAREVASTATASMKPELEKIESKISSLTDSMRVMQDDLELRKEELKDKWGIRMNEVEDLILPLLQNLAKDGDKREWIRWPNRTDLLNKQIDAITAVTRGDY
jgi:molecular chaperone GrpE (heat shock protein)